MTELEFLKIDIDDKHYTRDVRVSVFGIRYLYLDKNTRIRYGYNVFYFGVVYQLQRLGIFWRSVAWTYPETHRYGARLKTIINYLFWYERDRKTKYNECKF